MQTFVVKILAKQYWHLFQSILHAFKIWASKFTQKFMKLLVIFLSTILNVMILVEKVHLCLLASCILAIIIHYESPCSFSPAQLQLVLVKPFMRRSFRPPVSASVSPRSTWACHILYHSKVLDCQICIKSLDNLFYIVCIIFSPSLTNSGQP